MAKTTSQAKNAIARCLWGTVHPYPSKKQLTQVWEHFQNQCAYCNKLLNRQNREGHMDHLVPLINGGANDLGNYALACRECNGDKKREKDWLSFLQREQPEHFELRKSNIETWIAKNIEQRTDIPEELRSSVIAAIERISSQIDREAAALRSERDSTG